MARRYVKKKKALPAPPSFVCLGCGLTIYPRSRHQKEYCQDSKCQQKRIAANTARWRELHPNIRREKKNNDKPVVVLREQFQVVSKVKVERPERTYVYPLGGDRALNVNRFSEAGFKRYWAERPFHFGQLWPGKTISQAWELSQGKTGRQTRSGYAAV